MYGPRYEGWVLPVHDVQISTVTFGVGVPTVVIRSGYVVSERRANCKRS